MGGCFKCSGLLLFYKICYGVNFYFFMWKKCIVYYVWSRGKLFGKRMVWFVVGCSGIRLENIVGWSMCIRFNKNIVRKFRFCYFVSFMGSYWRMCNRNFR